MSSSSSQMKYWTWMKRWAAARSAFRRLNFSLSGGEDLGAVGRHDTKPVLAGHGVGQTLDEGAAEAFAKTPIGGGVALEERLQGGTHPRDVVPQPLPLFCDDRPVAAGEEVEDHAQHGHQQECERPGERVRRLTVLHDQRGHDVQPQDQVGNQDPPGEESEPMHADLTLLRLSRTRVLRELVGRTWNCSGKVCQRPRRRARRFMPASDTGESGRPKGSMNTETSSPLRAAGCPRARPPCR